MSAVAHAPNQNEDRRSHTRKSFLWPLWASLKDLGKKWFAFSRMEIWGEALLTKI